MWADGSAFIVMTPMPFITRDRGKRWAGTTFASAGTTGLPGDISDDRPSSSERPLPLLATTGKVGDLWFVAKSGLFHSTDSGRSFAVVRSSLRAEVLGFGKSPPGRSYPALFAIGVRDDVRAIWRSDDVGVTWVRVNDTRHEYGRRFRCIAGDPRVFGRVYVGTDGRGIVYGEPLSARESWSAGKASGAGEAASAGKASPDGFH